MTREVQLRRGSTVDHSTFAGAEGEVTYDTDLKTLVAHDGATLGGFPMAGGDALAYGDHVPAVTLITNLAAASIISGGYSRVGDRCHVYGSMTFDATALGNALTVAEIALPVASTFGSAHDVSGFAIQTGGVGLPGWVEAAGTTAIISWYAGADGTLKFAFDYPVQ